MMKRTRTRRGSILLLVIGLLAIMAMLGSTFLFVARMNRRETDALAAKAKMDPVAQYAVQKLSAKLVADLHCGSTVERPYADMSNGDWAKYIDYPSSNADSFLATADPPNVSTSLTPSGINYSNLLGTSTSYVDLDNDGKDDAQMVNTDITDSDGNKYYLAARVIDLGGMINVSTAQKLVPTNAFSFFSQLNVDLEGFLNQEAGSGVYATLNEARCTKTTLLNSASQFYYDLPQLNYWTNQGYIPFTVSDECYLRNLEPDSSFVDIGRLYNIIGPGLAGKSNTVARRYLTTWNINRILPRRPASDWECMSQLWYKRAVIVTPFPNTLDPDQQSDARFSMNTIYTALRNFFNRTGLSSKISKEDTACFVVNLKALCASKSTAAIRSYSFRPKANDGTGSSDENFIVYPFAEDLVITEIYTAHNTTTYTWGAAVEIFNPTPDPIDLSGYSVTFGGSSPTLPSYSLPSGSRAVLYNTGTWRPDGDTPAPAPDLNSIGFSTGAGWINVSWLDLRSGNREFTLTNRSIRAPIDRFVETGKDHGVLDYSAPSGDIWPGTTAHPTKAISLRRDDSSWRCNVAVYKRYETASPSTAAHKLGAANGLTSATVMIGNSEHPDIRPSGDSAQYPLHMYHLGRGPVGIGEIRQMPFLGRVRAVSGSTDYGVASMRVLTDDYKSVFPDGPARGRLDVHPNQYVSTGTAIDCVELNSAYPPVPAGCLFEEFMCQLIPGPKYYEQVHGGALTDEEISRNTQIFGRVNLNTASREVLARLPFPTSFSFRSQTYSVDRYKVADYIIAYRDGGTVDGRSYSNRASAAGIAGLRDSTTNGFLTPGEVAIPLADYVNNRIGWSNYSQSPAAGGNSTAIERVWASDYLFIRDSLYSYISNLVAVNSDVYAMLLEVQARESDGTTLINTQKYLVILDRSDCYSADDTPAVLMFTPTK